MKGSEMGEPQAGAILGIFTYLFGAGLRSRGLQTDRNCWSLIRSCRRGQNVNCGGFILLNLQLRMMVTHSKFWSLHTISAAPWVQAHICESGDRTLCPPTPTAMINTIGRIKSNKTKQKETTPNIQTNKKQIQQYFLLQHTNAKKKHTLVIQLEKIF